MEIFSHVLLLALICFIFMGLGDSVSSAVAPPEKVPIGINNYLYILGEGTDTWLGAFITCVNIGGHMASPLNPGFDNDLRLFLIEKEMESEEIWLGAREFEGRWQWTTYNQNVTFTNFHELSSCSEPQEGFGLTGQFTDKWGWCSTNQNDSLRYVCEFQNGPITQPTTSTSEDATVTMTTASTSEGTSTLSPSTTGQSVTIDSSTTEMQTTEVSTIETSFPTSVSSIVTPSTTLTSTTLISTATPSTVLPTTGFPSTVPASTNQPTTAPTNMPSTESMTTISSTLVDETTIENSAGGNYRDRRWMQILMFTSILLFFQH